MYLKFNNDLDVSNFINKSYTFNFQSNGINYSEMHFTEVTLLVAMYVMAYNSTLVGSTTIQLNRITLSENYKYIYLEDSELDKITDTTFKSWLLTNTTECSGYFQELNGIRYFVDIKHSPETTLQNYFNILSSDIYLPNVTPMTLNYLNSNFNIDIGSYFYLQLQTDNNYLQLDYDSQSNTYKWYYNQNNAYYNSFFYLDNDNNLKFYDFKRNIHKYVSCVYERGYNQYRAMLFDEIMGYPCKLFVENEQYYLGAQIGGERVYFNTSSSYGGSFIILKQANSAPKIPLTKDNSINNIPISSITINESGYTLANKQLYLYPQSSKQISIYRESMVAQNYYCNYQRLPTSYNNTPIIGWKIDNIDYYNLPFVIPSNQNVYYMLLTRN